MDGRCAAQFVIQEWKDHGGKPSLRYRGYARPAIILTIQRLPRFIQPVEIYRRLYLSQQVIRWHQFVYPYNLYHIPILFPRSSISFHSLLLILSHIYEKAQLPLDFFDRLQSAPPMDGAGC